MFDDDIFCFDLFKSLLGYGLLEILLRFDDNEKYLDEFIIIIEGKMYFLSSGWKLIMGLGVLKFWFYGLCLVFSDIFDFDIVICIISEFWFLFVLLFIKRC